jgi:hypothetical protein
VNVKLFIASFIALILGTLIGTTLYEILLFIFDNRMSPLSPVFVNYTLMTCFGALIFDLPVLYLFGIWIYLILLKDNQAYIWSCALIGAVPGLFLFMSEMPFLIAIRKPTFSILALINGITISTLLHVIYKNILNKPLRNPG